MRKKYIFLRNTIIILLALLLVLFGIDQFFGLGSHFRFTSQMYTSDKLPQEFQDFSIAFISSSLEKSGHGTSVK